MVVPSLKTAKIPQNPAHLLCRLKIKYVVLGGWSEEEESGEIRRGSKGGDRSEL